MGNTYTTPEKTLCEIPWRKSASTYEQLIEEIKKINPEEVANILFVGPANAGKSSIINSFLSISTGHLEYKAFVGKRADSFTRNYNSFNDEDMLQLCCLWDSMGIEKVRDNGLLIEDIKLALKGHVKKGYTFNPKEKIKNDNQHFRNDPGLEDQVHCIAFVLDSNFVSEDRLSPYVHWITRLLDKAERLKIPYVCILNKIDEICPEVNADVGKAFRSIKVRDAVKSVHAILGIPEGHIHPVKNIGTDIEISNEAGLLVSIALRQLMHFAQSRIKELKRNEREAAT